MERQALEIVEAHSGDELSLLEREWTALLARCDRATIFQTWEWNEAWWRTFGRGKRLKLLLVRDRGELIGIGPFYVSRHLGTPLLRLAFLGTGASDYMDVIAPDDRSPEVCTALLRHLAATRRFDLADLQQLRPTAHLRQHVESRRHGPDVAVRSQEPCPYVRLPATWEEYEKRLGKKMRSNLSYYDRLLPKTFADVHIGLAEAGELPDVMTALFDLHQKRWNARLLPGVLGGSRVQAFHRLVASRLHARGWLRLLRTCIDGRTVATLYCFRFRERTYYYLGGFAPDLGRFSLGTVLTAHAIRQAIAEGCTEFDFLRGNEDYKHRWLPEMRTNARVLLARPRSLRSGAMLRLNRIESFVEHRAKAFAAKRKKR